MESKGAAGWRRRVVRATTFAVVAAMGALLGAAPAGADPARAPQPLFPTGTAKVEKVIEEVSYFYRIMNYQPFVAVAPVSKDAARYDSPEAATIAAVSAMSAGDFAWWRSTWTASAQRTMDERDRQLQRTVADWQAVWKRALDGKRVEITRRIETGPYVLVVYRLVPAASTTAEAQASPELATVLVREGEKWLATQDLAGDPVLSYWDQPGFRVPKIGRNVEP